MQLVQQLFELQRSCTACTTFAASDKVLEIQSCMGICTILATICIAFEQLLLSTCEHA